MQYEKKALCFLIILCIAPFVLADFTDTNWQTSWPVFDVNMKAQYQLVNENTLHWHDGRYYTQAQIDANFGNYYTRAQSDANWNKYIVINADINWVQLQNYPAACPAGQVANQFSDTGLNCISASGSNDTNWQTSWTILDANLKATYPLKADVNNWGAQNYVSYTGGIPLSTVVGNSGEYLTTNGTTLSWNNNISTTIFSSGTGQTMSTTGVDVNGLGLSMLANKDYGFACHLAADAQAASTGIQIAMNGPASPTDVSFTTIVWTSTTVFTTTAVTAYESYSTNTSSHGSGVDIFEMYGVVRNGANAGTLIPRLRTDKASQWVEVKKGSYCLYTGPLN